MQIRQADWRVGPPFFAAASAAMPSQKRAVIKCNADALPSSGDGPGGKGAFSTTRAVEWEDGGGCLVVFYLAACSQWRPRAVMYALPCCSSALRTAAVLPTRPVSRNKGCPDINININNVRL